MPDQPPGPRPGPPGPPPPVPRAGFVGMGALACLLFCYLAAAPYLPWWLTVGSVALWLVLFGLATRWFVPRPRRVPWLAVGGFVTWFAAVAVVARLTAT
ncbi:hypothetical protein [Nocardioides marmoraquaticus]